jgi:hypothetical protein
MYSEQGRMHDLQELLNSTTNRDLTGPGTQLVHAAEQSLRLMQFHPELAYRCGPLALNSLLAHLDSKKALNPLIFNSKSTTNGFSLAQVAEMSRQLGLNHQAAFRSPGAAFVLPAVVHLRAGHYADMLQKDGDRNFSCWDQFLAMAFAQLTYRDSLADIEVCLRSRPDQLYRMGFRSTVAHNTLARANRSRDWRTYHDLVQLLIARARRLYADESFGVESEQTVYALDSTTIDLCLSLFPWARFRSTKAAIKLHTLLLSRPLPPGELQRPGNWQMSYLPDQ